MRFHRIEGSRDVLRAVLARARETTVEGIVAEAPWPAALLEACTIEAADMLGLRLALSTGRTATVQLLITPLNQLSINHMMVNPNIEDGHPPTEEEASEIVSTLLEQLLYPAFEATPGAAMVIEREGEVVRLGPARKVS